MPCGIWLVIVLAIVVAVRCSYTRFGRHLFAIGSNERMARLCGVPVERTKIGVYTLPRRSPGSPACCSFRGCRSAIRLSRSGSSST